MKSITDIMMMVSTEYTGRFDVAPERIKLWEYQLSDMTTETIYAAAMHFVSTGSPHPPTIGQIRKHCVDLKFGELSPVSGSDAWMEVLAELQNPDGSFSDLRWETREALRGIGTIFDLKRAGKDISFERTHFLKSYASVSEKQATERYALPDVKQMVQSNMPALPAKQAPKALPAVTQKPDVLPPEEPYVYVGAGAHSAEVEQEMHDRQMKRVTDGRPLDFTDPYYQDRRRPSKEELDRLKGMIAGYEMVETI